MDKKVLRERVRKKQQQIRRRKMMKMGAYVVAIILVVIFVIRGILIPVVNRISGRSVDKPTQVQAETDQTTTDSGTGSDTADTTTTAVNAAVRYPLKNDLAKASQMSIGWNENENGKWYQNADGTYFAGGMQEIDGSPYYFDENGYIQTGWVSVGFDDYYFNDDGTYDPNTHKPRIALTFDDGPNYNTSKVIDVLNKYDIKATFFVLGSRAINNKDILKKMADSGMEIGNHTYNHLLLTKYDENKIRSEIEDTSEVIYSATKKRPKLLRPSYGSVNNKIKKVANMPIIIWDIDTLDWKYHNSKRITSRVVNKVRDGDIILMHDIYSASLNALSNIIPILQDNGYEFVTIDELFYYKGISLENGKVYGYAR